MKPLLFLVLLLSVYTHLPICNGGVADLAFKTTQIDAVPSRVCAGTVAECAAEAAEFAVDSEVSRRVLAMQKRYISYETLRRDLVPCSTPGSSYYNCGVSPANHYTRGCSVITRCARNFGD